MYTWVCGLVVVGCERRRQPRRAPPRRGGVGAILAVFRGQDAATATGTRRRALALKFSQLIMHHGNYLEKKQLIICGLIEHIKQIQDKHG